MKGDFRKWPEAANEAIQKLAKQLATSRWWSAAYKAKAKQYKIQNLGWSRDYRIIADQVEAAEKRVAVLEEALKVVRGQPFNITTKVMDIIDAALNK